MKSQNNVFNGVAAFGLLTLTAMAGRAGAAGSSGDLFTTPPAAAQPSPPAMAEPAPSPRRYQPITVGVEAGTTGAGVEANWRFANHFGVGSALDFLDYSRSGKIQDNDFSARVRLMTEPLTLDVYPWKRSSFHISGGLLFNQNHITGTANGTIDLNGTSYTGTATLDIKQQPVDPYLAIGGNLYFDHAHHFSLGGTLGVIYTGDPRVSLTANTTPAASSGDLQAEQDKIKHYAKDAEFWPVLKLSLNYSF